MNGELHPRSGTAKLYILRKEGRRVSALAESCLMLTRVDRHFYIGTNEESLLKVARAIET